MRKIFFDYLKTGKPHMSKNEMDMCFPVSKKNKNRYDYWICVIIRKKLTGYDIDIVIEKITSNRKRIITHNLSDNAIELLPKNIQNNIKNFIRSLFEDE